MLPIFPDNSRVAFIGDSITAANLVLPRVIHAYKTQNIASGIRFFNCGVAGGTAEFALASYDIDTAHYKPTHAVVAFGINDSDRDRLANPRSPERLEMLERAFETYQRSMRGLVDRLLSDGVEVTLCTPVPYDEYTPSDVPVFHGGYALMLGYAEFVRNLAKEKGVHLYDQHRILSTALASDPIISSDHVHPTDHGYFVLAREILAAQGIDVGEEKPVPDYFARWHSCVFRLRRVLATECMLVRDLNLPVEEKMAKMQKMLEDRSYGNPVFEAFIRAYLDDKMNERWLYSEIDRLYETDVFDR